MTPEGGVPGYRGGGVLEVGRPGGRVRVGRVGQGSDGLRGF